MTPVALGGDVDERHDYVDQVGRDGEHAVTTNRAQTSAAMATRRPAARILRDMGALSSATINRGKAVDCISAALPPDRGDAR
jgi:hypothetical protein